MNGNMDSLIRNANNIAVIGHIRPDGDAVGSCLGMRKYILDNYDKKNVTVYLEEFPDKFSFLCGADTVSHDFEREAHYELAICLDCSEPNRLGGAARFFEEAEKKICVDHHVSNSGFGDVFISEPGASSTCEVLCRTLDMSRIGRDAAECFYTGIVHDTGVFKHTNTGCETMCIAGELLKKGVNSEFIIDGTFYRKTFRQNKILGIGLNSAKLHLGGKMITAVLTAEDMEAAGVVKSDLDGIVDQIHVTDGVIISCFLYELCTGVWKGSLRAHRDADVNRIAGHFGGGGHIKAAGFEARMSPEEIIEEIKKLIEEQYNWTEC